MDLSYGAEYETFREEVKAFLKANWPLQGDEKQLSQDEQTLLFRKRAIEAGYLARSIPKAYGGSEQASDALRGPDHPRGVRQGPRAGRCRAASAP